MLSQWEILVIFFIINQSISEVIGSNNADDTEYKDLINHLDYGNVVEDDPIFIRQIRKYSRRLWHINCYSRTLCHCYSRLVRQYFCCDCTSGPCVPSFSTVYTPNNETISMNNITIGQQVLAGDNKGNVIISKVIGFLDKRPYEEAIYTTIKTLSGEKITLSGNHLIFICNNNESNKIEAIISSEIRAGYHNLLSITHMFTSSTNDLFLNKDPVISVTHHLYAGAYVPLTEHGTIIINGILASCYASFSHELSHWVLYPIRMAPTLLLDTQDSQYIDGVRLFPKILKTIGHLFHFSYNDPNRVLKFDLRPNE